MTTMTELDWLRILERKGEEIAPVLRDWFLEHDDEVGVAFADWILRTGRSYQHHQIPVGPYGQPEACWWYLLNPGRDYNPGNAMPRPLGNFGIPSIETRSEDGQLSVSYPSRIAAWMAIWEAWKKAYAADALGDFLK